MWDNATPSSPEVLNEHRKLALARAVLGAYLKVFKNKSEMSTEVNTLGFSEWRKDRTSATESVTINLTCDIPFSTVNELMNELEGNDLRIEILSSKYSKKKKDRDYSRFPNVEVFLELEFKLFNK